MSGPKPHCNSCQSTPREVDCHTFVFEREADLGGSLGNPNLVPVPWPGRAWSLSTGQVTWWKCPPPTHKNTPSTSATTPSGLKEVALPSSPVRRISCPQPWTCWSLAHNLAAPASPAVLRADTGPGVAKHQGLGHLLGWPSYFADGRTVAQRREGVLEAMLG